MNFSFAGDTLHIEDVDVHDIAKKVGTPFYAYSASELIKNYREFSAALKPFHNTIAYSVKANANLAITKTLSKLGAGADVVSAGEMYIAMKAGIKPSKIVFSGVGKTREELEAAIKNEILQINVESEAELDTIDQIATRLKTKANVAIRVNPDVDAKTHVKITTGKKDNKFGVDWDDAKGLYIKAKRMKGVKIVGIAMHIGSQLLDLDPFRLAFTKMAEMVSDLEASGIKLKNLDLGGGLGINYNVELPPTKAAYAEVIKETLGHFKKHIIVEPGRSLLGNTGILVSKVIYTKTMGPKNFIIVDAGMNDLMRPAMYDAWHTIVPGEKKGVAPITADIVGPICESSDVFAKDRIIAPVEQGDLVAMYSAGAYGSSMSSIYNFRPLVPEVMVSGKKFAVVRKRNTYEEMLANQSMPSWL
ncbi:diaminopimelate decarboxylase [Parelusimicrobium proximum]|uniref:diaminopimelate decarboxylase n=1 Tax=Parelusimicrobium proximum TaxID=3228953 RepID=UPI003D178F84